MKIIGNDHVVITVCRFDVAARIGRYEVQAGANLRREGAHEALRRLDHLRQKFHGVDFNARFLRGGD